MRVLWFTNTPSLGAKHLNSAGVGGSWIGSLEAALTKMPGIELGVAFPWSQSDSGPFTVGTTRYFPVLTKKIKGSVNKIVHRWSHQIEKGDHVQNYLKVIEEFKPDVIHLFGTETDYGLIISKTTIPCLVHIQGNLTIYHHKWYSGLTESDVRKYSNKWMRFKGHGLYHDYLLNKKMADREIRIFQSCKYLMGRTDWDRRISSILAPEAKYFHCEEIMRENFYKVNWKARVAKNEFTIITTIRKNIYKGLESVFECMRLLNQSYPTFKITWKIAGTKAEDEIAQLVETKYRSRFSEHNIQLLGPLQENELINEMLGADLFVHPSHIDNSPNSVCEAMLIGMPLIATNSGGTPSLLTDKVEGILLQDGDPYALAGAIVELIKDRDFANKLGANARTRAVIRHNPEEIVNNLCGLYSSVQSN